MYNVNLIFQNDRIEKHWMFRRHEVHAFFSLSEQCESCSEQGIYVSFYKPLEYTNQLMISVQICFDFPQTSIVLKMHFLVSTTTYW